MRAGDCKTIRGDVQTTAAAGRNVAAVVQGLIRLKACLISAKCS